MPASRPRRDDRPRTVLGRTDDADHDVPGDGGGGQSVHVGAYRARDGATGAPVHVDCDRPHAVAVVGKRGSGKSHTLGVLAEGLAAADGVAPVVVDPMGEFAALADAADGTVLPPRVRADALPPRAWCDLLALDPAGAAGALVWHAATHASTLDAMRDHVADADADPATRRAATNHLALADAWNVFDPTAGAASDHLHDAPLVLDCTDTPAPAANAVCHATATDLYHARTTEPATTPTLPWLLLDEAHVFLDGTARPALERLLTRGRTPGISLVTATQRPGALPPVVHSQTDLTVAHRLTNGHDRDAIATANPTHDVRTDLPTRTGDALIIDDATDTTHHAHVRDRHTPHDGTTPRATDPSNTHLTHPDHQDQPTRRHGRRQDRRHPQPDPSVDDER